MNQPVTVDCWEEQSTVNRIEAAMGSLVTPNLNDAVELAAMEDN